MYKEFDAGTPETQAKLSQLRRGGVQHLLNSDTITPDQAEAGHLYAACWSAAHVSSSPRSCLAGSIISEGAYEASSERWEKLMSMYAKADWHGKISGRLAEESFRARKPYWPIINYICVEERSIKEISAIYRINRDTASDWVKRAFERLARIVFLLEDSWDRDQERVLQ